MNHSCSPNVVWSWQASSPHTKEVRAVRDVEAGEELCTNYIDSFEVMKMHKLISWLIIYLLEHILTIQPSEAIVIPEMDV
mgnify:CR=1 FL=1